MGKKSPDTTEAPAEADTPEPQGYTVRPEPLLRRRITRLLTTLSEVSGKVTFNKFAVAALKAHCDRLERTLNLPPLQAEPEAGPKGASST